MKVVDTVHVTWTRKNNPSPKIFVILCNPLPRFYFSSWLDRVVVLACSLPGSDLGFLALFCPCPFSVPEQISSPGSHVNPDVCHMNNSWSVWRPMTQKGMDSACQNPACWNPACNYFILGEQVTCSSQAQRHLLSRAHISVCTTQPPPDSSSLMLDLFWVTAVWTVNGMNRISERHSSSPAVWAKVTHAFPPLRKTPNHQSFQQQVAGATF